MNISSYSPKFYAGGKTLNNYLNEIRKYTVPTPDEEVEIFERIAQGDTKAREEIVNRNQRFVYALAKIYSQSEEDVLDYVNEGNIGLITAINTFDVTIGTKFITHAVWYIRRSMNYYLLNTSNLINKSNNMKLGKKIDTVRQRFISEHGYGPTNEQIISLIKDNYGIEVKEVCDVYDLNVSSINSELDDDYTIEDNSEYNNRTSSVNTYETETDNVYMNEFIDSIMSEFDEKKRDIICMSFGIGYERPYTAREISEKYGMPEPDVNKFINYSILYLRENRYKFKVAI